MGITTCSIKELYRKTSSSARKFYVLYVIARILKRAIMNPPHDNVPEINSTLASNKNRKVKNGIHPEKTEGKKKEEAVEKVK